MGPPTRTTSGAAIASLILGILGFCGGLTSLPAVICGHLGLARIKRSNGTMGGGGMAVAGLILGYLALAGTAAFWGLAFLGSSRAEAREEASATLFPVSERAVPAFPERPEFEPLGEDGVRFGTLDLEGSRQLRVYLPAGDPATGSLDAVLIAPAGTNLLTGSLLDDGDYHDECLPYAEAGMVVVHYSIDGDLPLEDDEDTDAQTAAFKAFRNAHAGVVNGRDALEFTIARLPEVNPGRIFAAGHSSAGTLALLLGEHEPRLAGVVAYAPGYDLEKSFEDLVAVPLVEFIYPDLKNFVKRSSPKTHIARMNPPVFLFHAAGDMTVEVESSREAADALRALGKDVTYKEVEGGSHYAPMIARGIPAGIEWIQSR